MNEPRSSLLAEFQRLESLPTADSPIVARQRGRDLERLLQQLLTSEGLEPRIRLRPDGEEIDGSFVLDGRVLLLEAKWHALPIPASTIYAFRGKVDGKLVGTVGIFISISGYSSEAVDALTYGKELNILLFDRNDLYTACTGQVSCKTIVREKLRAAAERGIVYFTRAVAEITTEPAPIPARPPIFVICEGPSDAAFLSALMPRVVPDVSAKIIPAGGKITTANVFNSLVDFAPPNSGFIILVDSDGDIDGSIQSIVRRVTDPSRLEVMTADPTIEAWAFGNKTGKNVRAFLNDFKIQGSTVNPHELEKDDASFGRFASTLRGLAKRQ